MTTDLPKVPGPCPVCSNPNTQAYYSLERKVWFMRCPTWHPYDGCGKEGQKRQSMGEALKDWQKPVNTG